MPQRYDLVILGAGAGGLIAADWAVSLGARVAIVERDKIGGDCTWTGCVPSKALLKCAKVAHETKSAAHYGITTSTPIADMPRVPQYIRSAVEQIYEKTTTDELRRKGTDVYFGYPRFIDSSSIVAGDTILRSKRFLITTGAKPFVPAIAGLATVPFVTYRDIFDNELLPRSMVIIGAGPVGAEIARAYQRLGAQVSLVADRLLPKEDADARCAGACL